MAGEVTSEPTGAADSGGGLQAFQCTACGASITLRAKGQSLAVVCSACHAVINAADPTYRLICKQLGRGREPLIPLGRRGQLLGVTYEVIGFMIRSSGDGAYAWEEYLLWNPQYGFRWLHHSDGHWTLFCMIKEKPSVQRLIHQIAAYQGETYSLFERGTTRVTYVLGEFYWRVKVGDTSSISDYIAPPYMLSEERDHGEVVWSQGEYLEPSAICAAFQIQRAGPERVQVAPNQPSMFTGMLQPTVYRWILFMLFVLTVFVLSFGGGREVARENFRYLASAPTALVSQSFEVPDSWGNVVVDFVVEGAFINRWADFTTTLVNEISDDIAEGMVEVAYYSGMDSDGSWSEGSHQGRLVFADVSPGRYHLEMAVDVDRGSSLFGDSSPLHFTAIVRRGVTMWSNLVVAILALVLFPVLMYWRAHAFELNRWSNSSFSPYESDEE